MGKKTAEHYEVTPAVIRKCEKLAAKGLSIIQIGLSLGWCEDTIHRRKKENKELSEAIKRGQAQGIETVSNSLFENATGFNYEEVHEESRTEGAKDGEGKTTKHKKVIKKRALPNTTAQIFFLKNRDPANWKDKHDHAVSGDIIIKTNPGDEKL